MWFCWCLQLCHHDIMTLDYGYICLNLGPTLWMVRETRISSPPRGNLPWSGCFQC